MDARELDLRTSPYLLHVEPRLSVRTSLCLSFVASVPCTQSAGSGQATGSLPSRRRTRTAFALEKRSRPLASACESVWSGLFLLAGVPGRCWEASGCQHEGKRTPPRAWSPGALCVQRSRTATSAARLPGLFSGWSPDWTSCLSSRDYARHQGPANFE